MKFYEPEKRSNLQNAIIVIVVGILLNIIPSQLALYFELPVFLDCTGTILTAMLGGNLPAVIVGFASNAINGIKDPITMYYGMISILIAAVATFYYHKRFFTNIPRLFVVIFTFALIGGGIGSLFTFFLYGFSFGEGISAPFSIAFHEVLGWSKFSSQLLADIVIDVFDKAAVVVLAVFLFRFFPRSFKNHMNKVFLRDSSNEGANKILKHSLLRKVVVMVIVAEVLLGTIACAISFFLYRDNSISKFTSIASGVTKVAAIAINGDRVDEFIKDGHNAEGYDEIEQKLYSVKNSFPQTTYLYVYQILPDGCHVVFDLANGDEAGSAPGTVIEFDPSFEPMLPKLLAGEEIEPIISDDQYGWLLTVYRPIKNSAGKTVAYVAADITMDEILMDESTFFIKMLSLFFGLSIIIMSVVIELVKRGIVIPVNKMTRSAMKFAATTSIIGAADDIRDANLNSLKACVSRIDSLAIHTFDEIGHLYESLQSMAGDTFNFIQQVQAQSRRIMNMQEITINEFAEMVESRDKSTGNHIKKTAAYVEAIAVQLAHEGKFANILTPEYIHKLKRSAPLHDIGKIAVSDLILNKPGKLTDEEYKIMQTHTTAGYEILKNMEEQAGDTMDEDYLKESIEMAYYHHEKWDGTGYPNHMKGEEIPLSARIMAVADVFDALVAERVYKKPFTYEKAMAIITEGAGKHFDPVVVEAFKHISEKLYNERTRLDQSSQDSLV